MQTKSFFLAVLMTFLTLGLVAGIGKAYLSMTNQETTVETAAVSQPLPVAYTPPTQAPTMEQPVATATLPVITSSEAAAVALEAAGEGEELAAEPELVLFNGETTYEVKMVGESTLYIGAYDGELKYNSITGSEKPVVTSEQALVIAADYINYYQPVSITLKDYNTTLAYYIRFWNGANVYVDRAGNILAVQYVKYTSDDNSGSSSSGVSSGSSSDDSSSSHEDEPEHEEEDD